jgi:8-oxo-dGTP diphosphatase
VTTRIYSVVAIVTDDRGRFLAVSRKDDHADLGFPGGKIEAGESPEEALVRELYEEAGLLVSRRLLRSTFIHPDEGGRLCMAFDVTQYKGVAYSREGAWVGWAEPIRFLAAGATYREYFLALFKHRGMQLDLSELPPDPPVRAKARAAPEPPPPSPAPEPPPARAEPTLLDALHELTGVDGFAKHHITFLYGPAALALCPTTPLPQPRVTFDQRDFAALLREPVLSIRTHQQKSLIPLNLLRYMHSLGPRCVSAVIAVSPHRPPDDWELVSSNVIECQALQVGVLLTLKKNRASSKPVGTSVVAPSPARDAATTPLHQSLP